MTGSTSSKRTGPSPCPWCGALIRDGVVQHTRKCSAYADGYRDGVDDGASGVVAPGESIRPEGLQITRKMLTTAIRKMGYLLRDYPDDKETGKWIQDASAILDQGD